VVPAFGWVHTATVKLAEHLTSIRMNLRRHIPENAFIPRIICLHHCTPHLSAGRRALRHTYQGGAALRAFYVVLRQFFRRKAILTVTKIIPVRSPMGKEDKPVFQGDIAQLERRQQMFKTSAVAVFHIFIPFFVNQTKSDVSDPKNLQYRTALKIFQVR
jgi:hypothetical protein